MEQISRFLVAPTPTMAQVSSTAAEDNLSKIVQTLWINKNTF